MKKNIALIFLLLTYSLYAEIFLSDTTFDFGQVKQGTVVSGSFFVSTDNTFDTTVTVASSCDCLSAVSNFVTVSQNVGAEIKFEFDTSDYSDNVAKDLIISTANSEPQFFTVCGIINSTKKAKKQNVDFNFVNEKRFFEESDNLCFFSYSTCHKCSKTAKKLQKYAKSHEKTLYYYDLEDSANKENLYGLIKEFDFVPELPFIVYQNAFYFGQNEIDAFINAENVSQDYKTQKSAKNKFNIFAIILSGLLDGINPCAFTVIMLLISYLTLQLKSRRAILFSGIFYTASVFITYFLIGLGFFEFLRKLTSFSVISLVIRYIITIFLVIMAIFSLIDFILIKTGHSDKMFLKLPKTLQNQIRQNIRSQTKNFKIFATAISLGVIVSVFELACTGQVYFPIIGYMVESSDTRAYGILLLLIYNIGFIIPLVAVFAAVYFGVSSKRLGDFFGQHLDIVKIMFFVLFVAFAIINIL